MRRAAAHLHDRVLIRRLDVQAYDQALGLPRTMILVLPPGALSAGNGGV